MKYAELGKTGIRVSRMGLGGAPFGNGYANLDDQAIQSIVDAAIEGGVNYIDTAPIYGNGASENGIGKALEKNGQRQQIVLATKGVMRGEAYSYDNTIRSFEQSLRRLRTDYIDVIQLHEVESTSYEEAMEGTIAAFLKLKEDGKVRAIGVNAGKVELLLPYIRTGKIDTVQMWGRYTIIDCSARAVLFEEVRKYGVGMINGSVLGMGILAGTPAQFLQEKRQALLLEAQNRVEKLKALDASFFASQQSLIDAAYRFSLDCSDIDVTLMGATSIQDVIDNVACCAAERLPDHIERGVIEQFGQMKPLFEY